MQTIHFTTEDLDSPPVRCSHRPLAGDGFVHTDRCARKAEWGIIYGDHWQYPTDLTVHLEPYCEEHWQAKMAFWKQRQTEMLKEHVGDKPCG